MGKRKTIYLIVMITFLWSHLGQADYNAGFDWSNVSRIKIEEIRRLEQLKSKSEDYKFLLLSKQALINGELDIANYYLDKIDNSATSFLPVKKRYKAIIQFIKGNFEKVLEILSDPVFNDVRKYKHICLLKVISLMVVPVSNEMRIEMSKCRGFNEDYSINEQMWLNNMEMLKLNRTNEIAGSKISDIKSIIQDQELVRIWLKTGLYLGESRLIEKNLKSLPSSIFKSKRFRELMGFYYYRLGDFKKALSFIEDINTSNAENIRGNINLMEKKYELAFGHFKLALNKKSNSYNSLERAIPLAWILEQWADGNKLLGRLVEYGVDKNRLRALEVAFQIRQENFELAHRNLKLLESEYKGQAPMIVIQMLAYVAFRRNDVQTLKIMADKACKKFDGLNCWIMGQLLIWENISKTANRDEMIRGDRKFDIDSLKMKAEIKPIQEEVLIDQYDIEELDSSLISADDFLKKKK